MSQALSPLVRAEQARILYRQVPFASAVHVLLGALVVAVTGAGTVSRTAAVWYGLILATVMFRAVLWFAYRRSRPAPAMAARWGRWYFIAMLCSGIAWGSGAFLIFPQDSFVLQIFVAAAMLGLAAGLTANTLANVSVIYAFLLAGVTPYAAVFVLQGTLLHEVIALMIAIFVLGTIAMARNNSRMFIELITLRLEMGTQRDLAEQANVAKSKFLAAASHDLRQPLHALVLFVTALNERIRYPEVRDIVDNIHRCVAALNSLFEALLDVSRLDAGVVEPKRAHFVLGMVLNRLAPEYEPQAVAKGLTLGISGGEQVINSDPALVERILRNLIGNAIRYTSRGAVRVEAQGRGDQVEIAVHDTGPGIPPERREEIFHEFVQLTNPERDRTQGLGLGLAIVRRLVGLLQGTVRVESAVGGGSVFRVTLPRGELSAVVAPVPLETSLSPARPFTGLLMVVIDDERAVREAMQTLLDGWGCIVVTAEDAAGVRQALHSSGRRPDIFIADYRLREAVTGAQAIAQLQAEFGATIPGLIITGDTAPERLQESRASGYLLLHKPVQPGKLRTVLVNLLRESGAKK